jgi:O-antigen/teichoic acid export membrane protein
VNESLRNKATKGMLWSAIDKFAAQGGQFISGIILARLLMPEDFGLIGMLSIFIAISQTFIDSGMGSGLIQRQNRSDVDFSTVFVFNVVVSLFFYGVLYFSAPLIAGFFNMPQLLLLTRVLALNIIIYSLAIVQRLKLAIDIDFKTLAKVNVISVLTGGVIAIYFAYTGWGVWALVIQNIIIALVSVFLFWLLSKWKASLLFSKNSFKYLFGFGYKLLISGLYARGLNEIYNITIGKVYSAADLGYYNRSKQFAEVTSGTVTSILQQVTYPIMASLQNDKKRLISVYSRLIRLTAFFTLPAMTLLAILAEPFILLFLTEKWSPAIVLLQWLSFARIVTPISVINMNILNALGRSDLFLKVDLIKFPIIVLTLVVTIPLGVKAIIIGHVITSLISFFINAYLPGKLLGYGGVKQFLDIVPYILSTIIMAPCVYLSIMIFHSLILKLIIGCIVGVSSYWLIANVLKIEELKEVNLLIGKVLGKKSF